MIPRLFHFVWVGDEAQRPDQYIATWRRHHPEFELKIWGNEALYSRSWINAVHMRDYASRELSGVADLMRWEILLQEGGVTLDADSICLQRLPDWLFECEMFAAWESELARPGLIATGALGSMPANPFVARLIQSIRDEPSLTGRFAWQATGPGRLTEVHRRENYSNLTILPSHFFLPRHYTGIAYSGSGPVYADQCWDSTKLLLAAGERTNEAKTR